MFIFSNVRRGVLFYDLKPSQRKITRCMYDEYIKLDKDRAMFFYRATGLLIV